MVWLFFFSLANSETSFKILEEIQHFIEENNLWNNFLKDIFFVYSHFSNGSSDVHQRREMPSPSRGLHPPAAAAADPPHYRIVTQSLRKGRICCRSSLQTSILDDDPRDSRASSSYNCLASCLQLGSLQSSSIQLTLTVDYMYHL